MPCGRRRCPVIFSTQGLTCSCGGGSRVAPLDDYDDAFTFTGTITRVAVDLTGDLIPESANDMRSAMARR